MYHFNTVLLCVNKDTIIKKMGDLSAIMDSSCFNAIVITCDDFNFYDVPLFIISTPNMLLIRCAFFAIHLLHFKKFLF